MQSIIINAINNQQPNKQVLRLRGSAKTIKKDKHTKQQTYMQTAKQMAIKAVEQQGGNKLATSTSQCDLHFLLFMQACDTNPDRAFEILMENATIASLAKASDKAKSTNNEQYRIEGICEASIKRTNITNITKKQTNNQALFSQAMAPVTLIMDESSACIEGCTSIFRFPFVCFACFASLLH